MNSHLKSSIKTISLAQVFLFSAVICLSQSALAGPKKKIIFGNEFTFSNQEMLDSFSQDRNGMPVHYSDYSRKKVDRVANALNKLKADRTGSEKMTIEHSAGSSIHVEYPDGFKFKIYGEPGILEVNTSPHSYEEYLELTERINRDIFEVMENVGLQPQDFTGGGHIHVGGAGLFDDPILVRNFIVDFMNHSELSSSDLPEIPPFEEGGASLKPKAAILDQTWVNAVGINDLGQPNVKGLKKAISEFDKIENPSVSALRDLIMQKAQGPNVNPGPDPVYVNGFGGWGTRPTKYHDLNLRPLSDNVDSATVEIRSIRPQKNFDEFLRLAQMFQARIEFLKKKTTRVPVKVLPSPKLAQEAIERFSIYLAESGLDIEDYLFLEHPAWRITQEFSKFVDSCSNSIRTKLRKPISNE